MTMSKRNWSKISAGIIFIAVMLIGVWLFDSPTHKKQPFVDYGDIDFTLTYPILLNVTVKIPGVTHYTVDTPGGLCMVPGIYDIKKIPENLVIQLQIDSGFRIYYWVLHDDGVYRLIAMEGPQ